MVEFRKSSEKEPKPPVDGSPASAFGDVRFNRQSGELQRDDQTFRLTPKAAAVLAVLLEHAPSLVSKADLLRQVWGQRSVGDEVLTSCIRELRRALGDDARTPRYIETRHRRGYRLLSVESSSRKDPRMPASVRPTLAVLPFDNISPDKEQDYFADGITEDITTSLSRIRSFFVVSRNSSFAFKGRQVEAREVGLQLGARYLVEGSIQRAGKKLRISAKLIDTETSHHLWASQFDGLVGDVFELQDRLVTSVVSAIRPTIQDAEIARARLKRPDSLQAYDYLLRAFPGWRTLQDPAHEEATNLFHKAFELEPDYALAIAMAAWARGQRFGRVMKGDPEKNRRMAIELANTALALAPNDPGVIAASVNALIHGAHADDLDRCEGLLERALKLDPNSSMGWQRLGFLHVARSRPTAAIAAFERAIALGPLDPAQAYSRWGIGDAHFIAGRLSKALMFHRRCVAEKPLDPAGKRRVCALLALTGKIEEARQLAQRLLTDHPQFTLARIAQAKPFESPHVERYLEGLRLAGFS